MNSMPHDGPTHSSAGCLESDDAGSVASEPIFFVSNSSRESLASNRTWPLVPSERHRHPSDDASPEDDRIFWRSGDEVVQTKTHISFLHAGPASR